MKKTLLAIALAAATTTAYADTSLSGHINYAISDQTETSTTANDDQQDFRVTDSVTSGSRFRIISSKKAGGITWGTRIELGIGENADDDRIDIRNNFLSAKGGFGKVSLGKGSETGDGWNEIDFSGTYVLNGNNGLFGGGVDARDGGRTENLRYDSPKLAGLAVVSASYTEDEFNFGVRLDSKTWKANVWTQTQEDDGGDELGAAVAAKFGVFTGALQYSSVESTTSGVDDVENAMVILAYRSGPISVAVDFGERLDDGSDLEHVGVGVVYRPTKGVETYAGARNVDNGTDDGTAIALGARVKF